MCGGPVAEQCADLLVSLFGDHIADDYPETAPGRVALPVIGFHHLFADAGDQFPVADDRVAHRVNLEQLLIQRFKEPPGRIVHTELTFAQDHLALRPEAGFRELRIPHHRAEHLHRRPEMLGRHCRVISSVVVTGVGVHRAAEPVDRVGNGGAGVVAASLEHHVFEKVGEAAAEMPPLVDAAGADEAFDFDRGARLGQHVEPHAVFIVEGDDVAVEFHNAPNGLFQSIFGREACGCRGGPLSGSISGKSISNSSGESSCEAESSSAPISE